MSKISSPVIYEVNYNNESVESLEGEILQEEGPKAKYLLSYPTVYIVHDEKKSRKFSVYIGETSDIRQRTKQHLIEDPKKRDDWEELANSDDAKMYIIGHDFFNKSLTLDIENRLMMYMASVENVESVYNRRANQQKDYYTSDKLDGIFSKIWRGLRRKNKDLFPVEKIIKDSALFKASPFHKLTDEQIDAKDKVILKIMEALTKNETGELILVAGEAGSGKTVLMSSLFYELKQFAQDESENVVLQKANSYLLVNHEQ